MGRIMLEMRMPRVLAACFTGAAFALAGAVMQGLTGNPLADAGLLGINAGAGFLVALTAVLMPSLPASCVSVSGGIGFIGLVAPHIARRFVGARHRLLLPASMLTGGLFLLLADTMGRSLFQPIEIPVGISISVLAAPYFLYLLRGQI
jgi:ABC-type Fe3+-siderophore transport system permease subunit